MQIASKGNQYKGCDCLDSEKRLPPYKPFGAQIPTWKNGGHLPKVGKKPIHQDASEADPQCDMDAPSEVTFIWFRGLYPQFCSQITDPKKKFHADLTNKDYKKPSSSARKRSELGASSILGRTPPLDEGAFENYKFAFDWEPGDSSSCMKDCSQAFDDIATSPCKRINLLFLKVVRKKH